MPRGTCANSRRGRRSLRRGRRAASASARPAKSCRRRRLLPLRCSTKEGIGAERGCPFKLVLLSDQRRLELPNEINLALPLIAGPFSGVLKVTNGEDGPFPQTLAGRGSNVGVSPFNSELIRKASGPGATRGGLARAGAGQGIYELRRNPTAAAWCVNKSNSNTHRILGFRALYRPWTYAPGVPCEELRCAVPGR